MAQKIGLREAGEAEVSLIEGLLNAMQADGADFTNTFVALAKTLASDTPSELGEAVGAWVGLWRQRLEREKHNIEECVATMRRVNPTYIPRNHRIEAVIREAEDERKFSAFETLLQIVTPALR